MLSVYSSSNKKPTSQAASSLNRTPAKRDIYYHAPKNYFEIGRQQSEKIQTVIDTLMTLEDVEMYKIINLLQSFKFKYLEENNYVSDLYDYILRTANERINTAKRDFAKREYEIVIQIIVQLKEGISTNDIVRAILPPKEDVVNDVKNEVALTSTVESITPSIMR